jgi:hypothetical protein
MVRLWSEAHRGGWRSTVVIRIGPAGWSHKDWEGVGYPTRRPKGFQKATCLAHYFETVEINSTPSRGPLEYRIARNRVRRVSNNPGLRITAKVFRGFTHERNAGADDERQFKEGIDPLVEAGRLGALLLPFPWSCENDEGNRISVRLVPPLPLLFAGPRSATYRLGTNGDLRSDRRAAGSDFVATTSTGVRSPSRRARRRHPRSGTFASLATIARTSSRKTHRLETPFKRLAPVHPGGAL